jgi:hypothetical protein
MNRCLICDERTTQPWRAALWHFRLVDWGQWRYWKGNIRTFGLRSGLAGSFALSFPIYNTLRHWKYRKHRLVIPEDLAMNEGRYE